MAATNLKEAILELINQKLVVHLEAKCNKKPTFSSQTTAQTAPVWKKPHPNTHGPFRDK